MKLFNWLHYRFHSKKYILSIVDETGSPSERKIKEDKERDALAMEKKNSYKIRILYPRRETELIAADIVACRLFEKINNSDCKNIDEVHFDRSEEESVLFEITQYNYKQTCETDIYKDIIDANCFIVIVVPLNNSILGHDNFIKELDLCDAIYNDKLCDFFSSDKSMSKTRRNELLKSIKKKDIHLFIPVLCYNYSAKKEADAEHNLSFLPSSLNSIVPHRQYWDKFNASSFEKDIENCTSYIIQNISKYAIRKG